MNLTATLKKTIISYIGKFIENPSIVCPSDLVLLSILIPNDMNDIVQYANKTPANGLCGYLAYYQFVQARLHPDKVIVSPDLSNKDQLIQFKTFFEEIDTKSFKTNSDKNDKLYRHESLLNVLSRLHKETEEGVNEAGHYKVDTMMLPQQGWCKTDLMREYDRQKLNKSERILAVKHDSRDSFFLQFHYKDTGLHLSKQYWNKFQNSKYMMVYSDHHFFFAPCPLEGFNLHDKFEEFWELLKKRVNFYFETSI